MFCITAFYLRVTSVLSGRDMRIIGYEDFINLMKAAYVVKMSGVPSAHILVISPPGTAKTTMAKLFAKAVGARFVRTTGRYDMLPEDFIAEKEIVYENGSPKIVWSLRAVRHLLADENEVPGIWFFDELDKMNRKSMMALLELMEEQQVTLPNGETYPLNFMLIAAGNSRKFDRDANPIPRSVRDRFLVYWELGYLPVDLEHEVLDAAISYLVGNDTEPPPEMRNIPGNAVREFPGWVYEVRRRFECFVEAVAWLRKKREVREPPGPRAYIHATLLTAGLAAITSKLTADTARLGFMAGVAGKLGADDPLGLAEEAFMTVCGAGPSTEGKFFRGRGREGQEDEGGRRGPYGGLGTGRPW